jgi:hypothetical protein
MSRKTRVDGWRESQDKETGPAENAVHAGDVFPFTGVALSVPARAEPDQTVGTASPVDGPNDWSGQRNFDEVRSNPHTL